MAHRTMLVGTIINGKRVDFDEPLTVWQAIKERGKLQKAEDKNQPTFHAPS
jgi:hypothetical protein